MSEYNPNFLPDLDSLRLTQDFESVVGAKKILATIPVRKPDRQSWIRVHANPEMKLVTAVYECKEERATYLVDPSLWNELQGELIPKTIFVAIDTLGTLFLWLIKMPGADGRLDDWNLSAMKGAFDAQQQWVRVAANLAKGAYDIFHGSMQRPEPQWPEMTFRELLQIAFKGRFIQTLDHPTILRLQGKL